MAAKANCHTLCAAQLKACSALRASPLAKFCNRRKVREKAQCHKAIRAEVRDCKSMFLASCESTGSC
jgi:hypothetical protein